MAGKMLRSNHQDQAFQAMGLFCLMILLQRSSATQFTVGGTKGWTVPGNSSVNGYNQWAERMRFQIGDTILFAYDPDHDSVLQVTKEDYANCTTASPLKRYTDGHTVFSFHRSGPYYFISGNEDNCLKNEKIVTVVLADRSNNSSTANQTNTASPPSPDSMGMAPSPTPTSEGGPPTGTVEINPVPAPANQPSSAAFTYISFIGSIGAFFASSLILVI